MDETPPTPAAPKRRGRKPKISLAPKTDEETPSKTNASNDSKIEEKADDKNDSLDESGEKAAKPEKLSLSERKQAKKAQIEAIIASGGRGKRTPKPNPKYMDEPTASASKGGRDENDSENPDAEDGDDELQLSADEPRNEGPLKKRMLQKIGFKSGPGRKPSFGKGTPGRKPAAFKRKLDVDIDIDDEHGKQLFLDAKRRFQNSPSGSEEDGQLKKSKSPITDALAAKLRSKYPNDITVKRTIVLDNKVSPINRARLLERNKIALQKEGGIELRKHTLAEDTETSEDDLSAGKGTSDQDIASPKHSNRRKTQHTKILSDDKIVRASSSNSPATIVRRQIGGTTVVTKPFKSPLTQNQQSQSKLQASTTKTYSLSPHSRVIGNKPAILRQPPRILNSTLCKPTNKPTVPSLVTKVVTKDDYDHELNRKRNNNVLSSRSKENNVTSYVYTEKDGKIIPKKTVTQASPQQTKIIQRKSVLPVVRASPAQQKFVSETVSLNLPNSRRARRITCFETWYVIKMPEVQTKIEKSILNLSLMQIGNEIKKIELPSSEWTYKILLQPLNKQLLALRKTKADEKVAESASEASKADAKNESKTESEENDVKTENKEESVKSESTEESKDVEVKTEKSSDDAADEKQEDATETDEKSEANSPDQKKADKKKSNAKSVVKSEDKSMADNSDNQTDESKASAEVTSSTEEPKEKKSDEKNESASSDPSEVSKAYDVYTGEVHDPNINPDERANYRPINIMFRRKCQNPNIRIQFDRTVILKNQTFYLNVDGKNVRLVASPQTIETYDDIKTLLQIVDDISLDNCCIELATHIS